LIFLPTLDSDLQQAQGKFLEGNKTSFDGVFEQVKTVFPQYEKERLQIEEEQTKTSQMLKDIKEEKDILEDEKNNLEEEINFIRLLSPENQEIVRKLKEQ
jgi:peptide subunit release factor RF-3